ncbi:MAG: Tyrosine recombinase XerC [Chroococcopsis gigantea SAG 12.99]|jgi:integrase|nr:tyrosine-type recombinase/integrase [Chlorogloea purpurea SAG 13.99]MDV3001398.1 Tyrosine recombinase XerC [Chroococcopsis gigantea SAG 12.99]
MVDSQHHNSVVFPSAGVAPGRSFVKVESDNGRLRLRFSYGGKRYALAVGLPDSKVNRLVALQKAAQIELDIASGNFDSTLSKYKTPKSTPVKQKEETVADLFVRFMDAQIKLKELQKGSLCRYRATLKHLGRYFPIKTANSIDDKDAEGFVKYLRGQVSTRTAKDYLILVKACWNWARQDLSNDPWAELVDHIKPPPKQKVKPFTVGEVKTILEGFANSLYYSHYKDFVTFLFGTGCRFGEAVALKWKHISDDCSSVWIGESVSRGNRKTTKTGKDRTITLTTKIAMMLMERKPDRCTPDDLVFPAPGGGTINDHTFRRKAWKTVLSQSGIEYRKPYSTRHTAISHALANGANPLAVAEATGHDPHILFKYYASVIQRSAVMIEF